jgi:hypothetical protein
MHKGPAGFRVRNGRDWVGGGNVRSVIEDTKSSALQVRHEVLRYELAVSGEEGSGLDQPCWAHYERI